MVHRLVFDALAGRRSRGGDERGAVMVIMTLLLVVVLMFVALAVDLGHAREERRQVQAAADAAALAATDDVSAATFSWPAVVTDAKLYGSQNVGVPTSAWVGCTDTGALSYRPDSVNNDACISADSSVAPTRIRVHIPLQGVKTHFASIIGISSLQVSASAVGGISGTGPCDLCVLSPTASYALSGTGNASFNVMNGAVVVNSTGSPAASLTGSPAASLTAVRIGGPAAPSRFTTTGNATYNPTPVTENPVSDPLASIPMCPGAGTPSPCPTTVQTNVILNANQSQTISPGIYNSISASGNGNLTMNPGTYIITGSLSFTGNGNLIGNGVTLYFACAEYPSPCSNGESGATFALTGNGIMTMSAPTSGVFQGLSIFADRNNTASDSLTGNGSGFSGTIYQKSGNLTLTGNGQTLNSRVIVNTVALVGNGSININATSNANVTIRTAALIG